MHQPHQSASSFAAPCHVNVASAPLPHRSLLHPIVAHVRWLPHRASVPSPTLPSPTTTPASPFKSRRFHPGRTFSPTLSSLFTPLQSTQTTPQPSSSAYCPTLVAGALLPVPESTSSPLPSPLFRAAPTTGHLPADPRTDSFESKLPLYSSVL
jgi:hypothetical protein